MVVVVVVVVHIQTQTLHTSTAQQTLANKLGFVVALIFGQLVQHTATVQAEEAVRDSAGDLYIYVQ